ncbi:MAG: hypothetical protein IT317_16115 [Anaerolineales bacterium]|nr:hypothetical protein [Anaerolineales bacterium]
MSDYEQLMAYIVKSFPPYAVISSPGSEASVDGLIFRPLPHGGFTFLNDAGQQDVTLAEAISILEAELALYS